MRTWVWMCVAAVLLGGCGEDRAAPSPGSSLPAAEPAAAEAAPVPGGQAGAAPGAQAAAADVVYLDVRTAAEFSGGHVDGAINIPVEEIEQRWQELAPYRDRPMVVYCRSGRRSGIAIDVLRAQGFQLLENGINVERLAGRGVRISR